MTESSDRPQTPTTPYERERINLGSMSGEERLSRLEARQEVLFERMFSIERRAGKTEQGQVRIEARMVHMEGQLVALRSVVDQATAGIAQLQAGVTEVLDATSTQRALTKRGGVLGLLAVVALNALAAWLLGR